MGNEFTVTCFVSSTPDGLDLANRINNEVFIKFVNDILRREGAPDLRAVIRLVLPTDLEYNPTHFHIIQNKSDVVIFDGSIEECEGGLLGDNYKCVPHAPYMNDNVLIVSRTVLPLNFIPHTTNVLPFGENFNIGIDGSLTPVTYYDNDNIMVFIKEHIEKNICMRFSPATNKNEELSSVKKDPNLFISNGEKIAFISYRSHYYGGEHKCGDSDVETLKKHILDYHRLKDPGEKWKVIFYPPGGLSQDSPTEYLRWALLTYVYNVFIHVDEVWIFGSNSNDEKSYWDSWFTQGEYLSLMMIQKGLPERMPSVFIFDPHTKESKELKQLPSIADPLHAELSLLSAHSDILWGDYAALTNVTMSLREWKESGNIKRRLIRGLVRSLSLIVHLINKKTPLLDLEKMSELHAYQPEFLTNRIFSCDVCVKTGYDMSAFEDDEFIRGFIKIGLNENPLPGYFALTKEEFQQGVERGYVECPLCHKRIYIKRNPSQDFYLWKKRTQRTSPDNWYIEKIPAYSVINEY